MLRIGAASVCPKHCSKGTRGRTLTVWRSTVNMEQWQEIERIGDQIAMREHHPLGLAGRAARVEETDQIICVALGRWGWRMCRDQGVRRNQVIRHRGSFADVHDVTQTGQFLAL